MNQEREIKAVLFDYGGVLAEEGFREGLGAIGRKNGIDPEEVVKAGFDLVHRTGYVVGGGHEAAFWEAVREETGAVGSDDELRGEILSRFVLRPRMVEVVDALRGMGFVVGLLSDQTQWLEELDARDGFFEHFDHVFNSYRVGLSKRDPAVFDRAAETLGLQPEEILFIDDNQGNVERAAGRGFRTWLFNDTEEFLGFVGERFLL